jgi:hypothetical protein
LFSIGINISASGLFSQPCKTGPVCDMKFAQIYSTQAVGCKEKNNKATSKHKHQMGLKSLFKTESKLI